MITCKFLITLLIGLISSDVLSANQIKAINGEIDLRQESFDNNNTLDGEWKFYWKELINPGEIPKGQGQLIDFPSNWNDFTKKDKKLSSFGFATYHLKILLPKSQEQLGLLIPEVYCAYKLFIGDSLVATNGQVSKSATGFIPHWHYNTVNVPTSMDTLFLTLQISNFVHSKGGIGESIKIGKKKVLVHERKISEAIDLILTGCLIMGGLFFLGLYLSGSMNKAILLFALYSLVYSYRIIGIENYVLHDIFPDLSWYLTVRLEYLSLFLSVGLFTLYTKYLYPLDVNTYIINALTTLCFSFSLASILFAPIYFTQLINPFLLVSLFCLIYTPYVYLLAYKNKRPGSIYTLISSSAMMCIFALSLFRYWGLIPSYQLLSFVCYLSFFFLQSLALSYKVSFALKKSRTDAEMGLKVKSEFLSTMSHEIRTPLNSVIGISHLLLKNNPRQDQKEQLDVMLFSANNLLAIVNDILDYNKIEAGKISFEEIEMDVLVIVNNIVTGLKNVAQDKDIDLRLVVDESLQNKVIGDPTRLSQVISNLVHNAIKFTSKGFVEVGIKVKESTETTVTLRISVQDTGIGISKENQKRIFERFTQADSSTSRGFGGTGLGLSISKKLLELQNSALHVDSTEGEGSVFYFVQTFEKSLTPILPLQTLNLPKEDTQPLSGVHILLVDDNQMNVMVAKSFLNRWGASIDIALNGLEALQKLDIHKHQLVLLDLNMPIMDGYEAAKKIRERNVTIPIIALTATLATEIEKDVKDVGMNDIVVKPFLPDELYRKVLHYINFR